MVKASRLGRDSSSRLGISLNNNMLTGIKISQKCFNWHSIYPRFLKISITIVKLWNKSSLCFFPSLRLLASNISFQTSLFKMFYHSLCDTLITFTNWEIFSGKEISLWNILLHGNFWLFSVGWLLDSWINNSFSKHFPEVSADNARPPLLLLLVDIMPGVISHQTYLIIVTCGLKAIFCQKSPKTVIHSALLNWLGDRCDQGYQIGQDDQGDRNDQGDQGNRKEVSSYLECLCLCCRLCYCLCLCVLLWFLNS